MNEVKFNSQVCTTKEQSERLLKLGLKPETADCFHWEYAGRRYIGNIDDEGLTENDVPAWSLHRLMELYSCVEDTSSLCIKDISYKLLIFCIEKAIHCGFFNKEYLNK